MADSAQEDRDADRRSGAPRTVDACLRRAGQALRQWQPHPAAVPGRSGEGDVRDGLLLGRRAQVLGDPRRLLNGRGLRRRADAQPDLPGSLLGPHRPQRGGHGVVRPDEDVVRSVAAGVLGESRSDPGHASGQRRGHPVPFRHLRLLGRPEGKGRGLARRLPARAGEEPHERDHDGGSWTLRRSIAPRTITSSTSPRIPAFIAAWAARASAARSDSRSRRSSCWGRATPVARLLMLIWTASVPLAHERARGSRSRRP